MALWLNHVAIAAPRNGTTTHTVDPNGGTVVAGANFIPTAGRFLVLVVEGAVTSTTPSGWTLEASAVNNSGLYCWSRTAAGSDTISTTHNGSNYPVIFYWFEFAAGTTWVTDNSGTNLNLANDLNPQITGLTGTNLVMAARGQADGVQGDGAQTGTWDSPNIELIDTNVDNDSGSTNGYVLEMAYQEDYTSSSYWPRCTMNFITVGNEGITWAINVAELTTLPYTEVEWNLKFQAPAALAEIYEFRVYSGSSQLASYLETPQLTLTSAGGGLTESPTDNVGITDDEDIHLYKVIDAPTDDIGITDSAVIAISLLVTEVDDIGIVDSATVALAKSRAFTDNIGILDSTTVVEVDAVSTTDNIGILDSATVVFAKAVTVTDNVGILDSATVNRAISRQFTDNIGITDSTTIVEVDAVSTTDNVGILDSVALARVTIREFEDDIGITDTAVAAAGLTIAETDDIGILDSVVTVVANAIEVIDPIGIDDDVDEVEINAYLEIVDDNIGITDIAVVVVANVVTRTDNIGITDTITVAVGGVVVVTDNVGITDSATRAWNRGRQFTDNVGISDTVLVQVANAIVLSISDVIGITDEVLTIIPVPSGNICLTIGPPTFVRRVAAVELQDRTAAIEMGEHHAGGPMFRTRLAALVTVLRVATHLFRSRSAGDPEFQDRDATLAFQDRQADVVLDCEEV